MTTDLKRLSVVGLGKLGVPLAACFASKGFPTIGVDVDQSKIAAINRGVSPLYEPRLQDLIGSIDGRLVATHDYQTAIMESDVTFIVVATPSDDRGTFSLRYVLAAAERIGDVLRQKAGYHLVVLTSTVMPGATERELKPILEGRSGKKCGTDFGLCYNPEFIALGSVVRDFLNPDFILIGESDPASGEMLANLYRKTCDNNPPVARMNIINAELTKLAVNTFVTTKISFANMLARICERLPGADVQVVCSALGLDSRIGRKYLKGAIGYGGPCFPRDNVALTSLARSLDAPATLAEATDRFNRHQVGWLASLVASHLTKGGTVGILGLAYKPNSDVVEESPGLLLAQALAGKGVTVVAFDPAAADNGRRVLDRSVKFAPSAAECVRLAEVIVITTPWDEFKQLTAEDFKRYDTPRVLIDCWRLLAGVMQPGNLTYIPLGVGATNAAEAAKGSREVL